MKSRLHTILLAITITLSSLSAVPAIVSAVDVIDPICTQPSVQSLPADRKPQVCRDNAANESNENNPIVGPNGILTKGVRILSIVVGVAAVVALMLAGIRFVLSGGNSESVAQARRAIIYAAIGLVIAATAQVIVSFILSRIGV